VTIGAVNVIRSDLNWSARHRAFIDLDGGTLDRVIESHFMAGEPFSFSIAVSSAGALTWGSSSMKLSVGAASLRPPTNQKTTPSGRPLEFTGVD
jgi:hypothetical protein